MTERSKTPTAQSALKVLEVLDVLLRHFAHGMAPGEIAQAARMSPSLVTRYVATLEQAGFAERVPETGRIRPSVRLARAATSILHDLEQAAGRYQELHSRIHNH